jgi:predicted transcriptional regulator
LDSQVNNGLSGALFNAGALNLFFAIAKNSRGSINLQIDEDLTKKAYYSSISRLKRCGLINRSHNKYRLTMYGHKIYDLIQECVKVEQLDKWKCQALDAQVDDITKEKLMKELFP